MRYGKLQFDVIKEWLKYDDCYKREIKALNKFFYNGFYYIPIMYKSQFVYFIPETYYTLSDRVTFDMSLEEVFKSVIKNHIVATYSIDHEKMFVYLYSDDHTVIIDKRSLKYFGDIDSLSFYIKDEKTPVYIEEAGFPRAIILPIKIEGVSK